MTSTYAFQKKPVDSKPVSSYRAWKQKDKVQEVRIDSVHDFPQLVSQQKKTVFEGMSLASKLKEVLAAEEEAAIQKRLKKGETPEQILRESCTILPLKSSSTWTREEIPIPDWVLDHSDPIVFPSFQHKSLQEIQEQQRWARLGINPTQTKLYDLEQDDNLSVISMPTENQEEDFSDSEEE